MNLSLAVLERCGFKIVVGGVSSSKKDPEVVEKFGQFGAVAAGRACVAHIIGTGNAELILSKAGWKWRINRMC